jgi:uncharacterized membrane-anchored protein YhcB (DUF1043 family)
MVMEWTLTAAVGLMVGISFGILLELKYIIDIDRKMEHLMNRLEKEELKTEREVESVIKRRRRR